MGRETFNETRGRGRVMKMGGTPFKQKNLINIISKMRYNIQFDVFQAFVQNNNFNQILPRQVSTVIFLEILCGQKSPLLDLCVLIAAFLNVNVSNINKVKISSNIPI